MRTYISVWEKDKYIPHFMCDDAKWRLSLKEIVSGYRLKKHQTYTPYQCQSSGLSLEQMNEKVSSRYGRWGMADEQLGEKVVFASQLP